MHQRGGPTALITTAMTIWVFTFALGVAFTVTYPVDRRRLTPVILGHTLINSSIEPWLLLSFFTLPS